MTDTRERDAALRRLLVENATRSPVRPGLRVAVAALASAATVGLLATVVVLAANGTWRDLPAAATGEPYEMEPPHFVGPDDRVLGTPVVVASSTALEIDLGSPPEGTTGLAVMIRCLDRGSYTFEIAGFEASRQRANCLDTPPTAIVDNGGYLDYAPDEPAVLIVDVASREGRFAVWAGWIALAPDAEPSIAQAEALADGIVTREEYVAGFERFVSCLAALGYTVHGGDTSREVISYSIEGTVPGDSDRCYESEFRDVDREWQVSVED